MSELATVRDHGRVTKKMSKWTATEESGKEEIVAVETESDNSQRGINQLRNTLTLH